MIADLPPIQTGLPREKPVRIALLVYYLRILAHSKVLGDAQLPKPAPMTKWQAFAAAKGIAPKPKKDRLVYDEDKQEYVPRWGYKGKNKDKEDQWIHEVPNNAGQSSRLFSAA